MADDKLNTNPQENTPPDVAALLGADTPPEHEQAVISGMGEEAPAPAGKVIDKKRLLLQPKKQPFAYSSNHDAIVIL